jgi:hypothetical protein
VTGLRPRACRKEEEEEGLIIWTFLRKPMDELSVTMTEVLELTDSYDNGDRGTAEGSGSPPLSLCLPSEDNWAI